MNCHSENSKETTHSIFLQRYLLETLKKTYRYQERDKELEKAFVAQLKQYVQERFVYMDESGFENTLD
nr:hypothetical protein [[Leptolyngbya] sp. PCC 7376]